MSRHTWCDRYPGSFTAIGAYGLGCGKRREVGFTQCLVRCRRGKSRCGLVQVDTRNVCFGDIACLGMMPVQLIHVAGQGLCDSKFVPCFCFVSL